MSCCLNEGLDLAHHAILQLIMVLHLLAVLPMLLPFCFHVLHIGQLRLIAILLRGFPFAIVAACNHASTAGVGPDRASTGRTDQVVGPPIIGAIAPTLEQVMAGLIMQLQGCNHGVRHVVSQSTLELGALHEGNRLATEVDLLGQQLKDGNVHILLADAGNPTDMEPILIGRHQDRVDQVIGDVLRLPGQLTGVQEFLLAVRVIKEVIHRVPERNVDLSGYIADPRQL